MARRGDLLDGGDALREVAGEASIMVPDMRRPRLRRDVGEVHLAALVGLFELAADRTVAGEAEVGDGRGPAAPPAHDLIFGEFVEPGRIVVEASATENGLDAGLERHHRRVKVVGPGRIEDQFASYGPQYVQLPHRLELNPTSPQLIRTV